MKPQAFLTERQAREFCATQHANEEVAIIHSPLAQNKNGDFFVDSDPGIVRTWETLIFSGLGSEAA